MKEEDFSVTLELIVKGKNKEEAIKNFWETTIEDKGWLGVNVEKM